MPIVVVSTNKNFFAEYWKSSYTNNWHFHLKAKNNRVVAQSEGYKEKRKLIQTLVKLGFDYKEVAMPSDRLKPSKLKTVPFAVHAQIGD